MAEQLGREVEVLVEGASRSDPSKRFGRTAENRTVNFEGNCPAGALVRVEIDRSSPNALGGRLSPGAAAATA
jgi:tRNA-2-methylthio-N6-dimethylallyladenosine synthase